MKNIGEKGQKTIREVSLSQEGQLYIKLPNGMI
jgi:hypothetical protein